MEKKTLYLIPSSIGPKCSPIFSEVELDVIRSIKIFFVEDERSARRFLSSLKQEITISELGFYRFDKDSTIEDAENLLRLLDSSERVGLLSEAGVPCVADPGALLVRAAHKKDVRVVPLVGPCSILLALMASGLNGQKFSFHGYPPIEQGLCKDWILRLEEQSAKTDFTQMWIETPHRTVRMFELLKSTLKPNSLISIAHDIGGQSELFKTTIAKDAELKIKLSPRAPTVFGLLARAR